jgi:membrane associated rhomboid family serine protease
MGIRDEILKTFRKGSSLTRLIYLNIAVFILISIGSIIAYLLNNQELSVKILNLFSVPSSLKALVRPWTLITYHP